MCAGFYVFMTVLGSVVGVFRRAQRSKGWLLNCRNWWRPTSTTPALTVSGHVDVYVYVYVYVYQGSPLVYTVVETILPRVQAKKNITIQIHKMQYSMINYHKNTDLKNNIKSKIIPKIP